MEPSTDVVEKPRFVRAEPDAQGRLVAIGTLRHGLRVGTDAHHEFELRESLTADMFAAEQSASVNTPITYNAALLCQQLVRIGTFKGPFTVAMLGKLKRADFALLRAAQEELASVGEAAAPG